MTDRVPLDAPLEYGTKRAPMRPQPEPTDAEIAAEGPAAAHALINIAEDLGRYLRLVSGGALTLAVVDARGKTLRDKAGMGWGDAHEFANAAVGTPSLRQVLTAQAAILDGEGAIGRHLAGHIDQVAPAGRKQGS